MTERRQPPRRAAALVLQRGEDSAPRVVAKGQGLVAAQILEIARTHGIPIHEDQALVDVLMRLDVDQHIPPELYHVVAAILAFLYRLEVEAPPESAR
jgi:flagellar biosynthesis protein